MDLQDEENLEAVFNKICVRPEFYKPRDLWPGVRNAIKKQTRPGSFFRPPLRSAPAVLTGFAVCAALAVFLIPSTAKTIKGGLKKLFSLNYLVQLRDSPEIFGNLLVANAQAQEIVFNDMLLRIQITSVDEKAVKIDVSVFKKQSDGSMKLLSRPSIVTLRDKPAEIKVSDETGLMYRLKMIPSEQGNSTVYKCSLKPKNR